MNNPPQIPLSQMIQVLRTELQTSIDASRAEPLQFQIENIELEIQISVTKEVGAGGGISFWVLTGEGKTNHSNENTHTLKLGLRPIYTGGREILVASNETELPD